MNPLSANELRKAWLGFFERNGHTVVPSSGLIPHHPSAPLFTNAGMIQFVPYFLGEEATPFPRATSVQKCVRTADIDIVGTTTRHCTFFEMLGNFSLGDYFKENAIKLAWEFATEVMGFDGDRIWATVYLDDDEAEQIWRDTIGIPSERVQRLGDADNFWEMQKGLPGPCGPNTELYYDRGPEWGAEGGPEHGAEERYLEFWNLVFMQFNREPDLSLVDLPSKNVDTGAGFERNLLLLQGVDTVFDTDALRPLIDTAERLTDTRYGTDEASDVSLRILADHARAVSFLVSDGVFPSNEGRGYVLRRVIRRAVRHAYILGVDKLVTPDLVATTIELMGDAYPELVTNRTFITDVIGREEERFRQTLRTGSAILDTELAGLPEGGSLSGAVAFILHDTHGFPIDLTKEMAGEQGFTVDHHGFTAEMAEQRARAKAARKAEGVTDDAEPFIEILTDFGPTEFVGREETSSKARILGVVPTGKSDASQWIVLDRTPFYAESGGQVGDTGVLSGLSDPSFEVAVLDTTYALPGQLVRHTVVPSQGAAPLLAGMEVEASIDTARRDAIRRNHTATHLLHWALRSVLGEHVKQQGSFVSPDRLRFDFSHYESVSSEQIAEIEDLVNADVLGNAPARHFETTMDHAASLGAIAFFGDKYGDIVRVLQAGPHSTELCGGTHVRALGDIGGVKVVSEGSVGSNMRRIEAVTGFGPIERLRQEEQRVGRVAAAFGVAVDEVVDAAERSVIERKEFQKEIKALKQRLAVSQSADLAATAIEGVVIARVDALTRDELRDLAVAIRDQPAIRAVVLGGEPDGGGAALVAAVTKDSGLDASVLIADGSKAIKGGGGKHPEVAAAGGKDPEGITLALDHARAAAGVT